MFETTDGEHYFRAQWFYRAEDTVMLSFNSTCFSYFLLFFSGLLTFEVPKFSCYQVIKNHANLVDDKRVFLSDVEDDNPLNCIVSKVKIAQVAPNVGHHIIYQLVTNLLSLF